MAPAQEDGGRKRRGQNRRWVLAERPDAIPGPSTFRCELGAVPVPGAGEILVRNVYIPVDPGMRPRLSDHPTGTIEFEPLRIGETVGYMTVGQVVESHDPQFAAGDWVTDMLLWQDYAITTASTARKLGNIAGSPVDAISILGIPGLSAWFGLKELGRAKAGETVLVTSAAGTVGALAGQLARIEGCKVIGTAGSDEKCRYLCEELGFDAAINYRSVDNLAHALAIKAPEGFDVLFDNVGNAMIETVLPMMRLHGRIVICGKTGEYNLAPADCPGIVSTGCFVMRRLTMRGLFVYDFASAFPDALAQMALWRDQGRLQLRQMIVEGFERLPAIFESLFREGKGVGKTIVKIDEVS